jgi:hypothetical protein
MVDRQANDCPGPAPRDAAAKRPHGAARRRWLIIAMAGVAGVLSIVLALLRSLG